MADACSHCSEKNKHQDSIIWGDDSTLYIATPTAPSVDERQWNEEWSSRALPELPKMKRSQSPLWNSTAGIGTGTERARSPRHEQDRFHLSVPVVRSNSGIIRDSSYGRWSWRRAVSVRSSNAQLQQQPGPAHSSLADWQQHLQEPSHREAQMQRPSFDTDTSKWTHPDFDSRSTNISLSLRDPRKSQGDGWQLPACHPPEGPNGCQRSSSVYSVSSLQAAATIVLFDGTVVMEDVRTGVWTFRPMSAQTLELLNSIKPWPENDNKLDKGVVVLPADLGTESQESLPEDLSTPPPSPTQLPTGPSLSPCREWFFIANVCLAQFFSLAGLSQSLAPLFMLGEFFGTQDFGQISWYTAAYSMSLGTFILPAGRMGDMWGHKRVFVVGWIWFAIWSAFAGFSWFTRDTIMFSTCRGLQGIGPAFLVPNAIALIGRTFPPGPKRALAISIFGGMGPIGVVAGVVFTSMFSQLLWWPWAFWMLAVACVLVAVLSVFVVPADAMRVKEPQSNASLSSVLQAFDIAGATTGVSSLMLINFALNQAPLVGWQHPYIPVILVIGIALFGVFVWVELRIAAHPIVPLRGLTKDAALTLTCIACGWASHGIWHYYLFLLLEGVQGLKPLQVCAHYWIVAPVGFGAALSTSFLLRKVRVAYLMSIAMLCFLVCIIPLAVSPAHGSWWSSVLPSVLIAPFAMNFSFPSGTILMSNAVPREHQGIAASLVSTAVNYSLATGLGLAGSIARYVTASHGVLAGLRGGWYFGVGLAGLGFLTSIYFILKTKAPR